MNLIVPLLQEGEPWLTAESVRTRMRVFTSTIIPLLRLFRAFAISRWRKKRDLVRDPIWLTLWQPPPGRQLPDYNVKVLKVVKRWHRVTDAYRCAPLNLLERVASVGGRRFLGETTHFTLYLDGIIFSPFPSSSPLPLRLIPSTFRV